MHNNMLGNIGFIRCTTGTHVKAAPNATTHLGPSVDMKGFEGCLCIYLGSTKFNNAGTTHRFNLRVGASTTALIQADHAYSVTIAAATSNSWNNKAVIVDVYKPLHRFIRPTMGIDWATTGNVKTQWVCIPYNFRRPGSTSLLDRSTGSTGVNVAAVIVSPATS